jgi:hypothetical protein
MAVPGNYSEPLVPLFRTHQSGTASGFANFDGLSQFESIMNSDQLSPLDEPPPPYPNNNSLLVGNLQSDVFSQSGLLPTERHLTDDGSISGTASPLAPVPLRHSSLYQVLKQNTPISPAQGTQQSGVSLIAHALGPQELQARQAPPVRTPLLGNKRGPTITSDSALSGGQLSTPTSLAPVAAAVEPPTLPLLHALPPPSTSVRAAATAQSPVSSATPPCAEAVPAQKEPIAVVTPTQAHTLVQSIPELTTQDYDTLPRLRKVSFYPRASTIPLPLPFQDKCRIPTYTYEKAASSRHSAPASLAGIRQRRPICCVEPALTIVIAPVVFGGRSGNVVDLARSSQYQYW